MPVIFEIPGHPGYAVTREGQVYSCHKRGSCKRGPWRPLIHQPCDGYPSVNLQLGGGRQIRRRVYLLMLWTFVGPKPFPKAVCRHLDGDRDNSRIENLVWGTAKENADDRVKHGRGPSFRRGSSRHSSWRPIGELNHSAKLDTETVIEIRAKREAGRSYYSLGKEYGVRQSTIRDLCLRITWAHVG